MKATRIFFILIINIGVAITLSGNTFGDSLLISKCKLPKESSVFLFTAGYRMPVNNNLIINSGHGLYFEGGINPGRLISKNLVVGLYAGWAFMDRLWTTSFNRTFAEDFDNSVDKDHNLSGLDKDVISSSSDLFKNTRGNSFTMPGCEMRSFHSYSLYYGLVIKLPYKYTPILKAYMGTTRSHFQGDYGIVTEGTDFNIFELRRAMYGCELIVFKGIENVFKNKKDKCSSNKNTGALSVYYEYCDFSNSSLYFYDGVNRTNIQLKRFTSDSFLKKYKNETSFGFKLSFYIM